MRNNPTVLQVPDQLQPLTLLHQASKDSGGCNPLGAGGREPGRAADAERRVRIDALQRCGPKKHRPLT